MEVWKMCMHKYMATNMCDQTSQSLAHTQRHINKIHANILHAAERIRLQDAIRKLFFFAAAVAAEQLKSYAWFMK